ncbi:hypothetical protein Bca52824_045572 [Brassica carinata]|uniref:3-hydroxyisobutyryl-CoA hydrolase n=1 Tax=Brassica carinata TaxID=52824 RepID=A0A8X7RAX9_BRACI|nr:hypothetical protein Bca52824_045572 [Brassica carinata]
MLEGLGGECSNGAVRVRCINFDGVTKVLVEETSNVRILTLNRPKQLNALSLNMITRLLQLFLAYEEDPSVKLVILKGQGRAFCAGGDVSAVVRDIRLGKWRRSADFMSLQYTLNYVMATYSKAQWEPRRLEDMKDNMVDKYFKRVEEEEGWEDLKLPPRKHLPASAIAKL